MVIAGGVLLATGVGGPAGVMLIAAGADTIIQKATTGEVNWGEVALSGAMGAVGGAAGSGIALKAGLTGIRQTVVIGGMDGTVSGGVMSTYNYLAAPGPHTLAGGLAAAGQGAA